MASALKPQAGQVRHDDQAQRPTWRALRQWRQHVGWVPQRIDAIPGLTARQQVAYAGWLRGMGRADAEKRAGQVLEMVELGAQCDERTSVLSGGQLRRVGIASALVGPSRVVLMDEPLAGLDPAQRMALQRLIASVEDVDWVISTHQTEDLGRFADHVCLMAEGNVCWQGTTAAFLAAGTGSDRTERATSAYQRLMTHPES